MKGNSLEVLGRFDPSALLWVAFFYLKRITRPVQSIKGIPKGKAEEMLEKGIPIRFPLGPSGESEDHTEGSRRLFAYFLVGEKVGPRRERIATSLRSSQ